MPKALPLPTSPPPSPPKPPKAHLMTYRIGRGEQLVLTFEPYKSSILPLWRFATPTLARKSSQLIYSKFKSYEEDDDFVGMDMCRKFLQMGMTRAKRYANHAGGRKYEKGTGRELERSKGHKGREEKKEASLIFREVWERAKGEREYLRMKEVFLKEQEWDKLNKEVKKEEDT